MCNTCTEAGRHELCPDCRARAGTSDLGMTRDDYSLSRVFAFAFAAYKQNLGVLTVAPLITFLAVGVINGITGMLQLLLHEQPLLALSINVLAIIPQTIVQGVLTLGMIRMALTAAQGGRPELEELFSQLPRLGSWLLQLLAVYAPLIPAALLYGGVLALFGFDPRGETALYALGGLTLLLVVPYAYLLLGLSLGSSVLVADPRAGALSALRRSLALTQGHRLRLLGAFITFGAVMFAGVLACGVGLLFASGYVSTAFATLYLVLNAGLPEERRA